MECSGPGPEKQPIGFWTVRAGEVITQRARSALEAVGVPQPQWWVLHQLTLAPDGVDEAAMLERIGPNESHEVVRCAVEAAVEQGRAERAGGLLRLTLVGREAFERAAAVQAELGEERMRGITQQELVTTNTVLQRLCRQVGAGRVALARALVPMR
ncbi:hypothetical protein [Kytococcus sedentarius]|uniref:hypothetical protein n=1 Tax=Kytococcus sedentarius TaxID=1276 RepID=UPI0035BC5309